MQYVGVSSDMLLQFLVIGIVVGICLTYVLVGVGSQRKVIQSSGREIICSVHEYFQKEYETGGSAIPLQRILKRTAAAVGKSEKTVRTIVNEKRRTEETGDKIRTPGKKRNYQARKTNVDSFTANAIKRAVYGMYKVDFVPSISDIKDDLEKKEIFKGSKWAVHKILKNLKFKFLKNNFGRTFLMQKPHVISSRFYFLRKMKELRNTGRPIIYLDETWLNINYSRNKVWVCEKSDSSIDPPLKVPLGKGQRFIIVHAGSVEGFVQNALYLFKSRSTKDYHEEMDGDRFEEWFKNQLLPNIPARSIIVLDNAKYHSMEINKAPVSSTRKQDMQEWLQERKIEYDPSATKPILYSIILQHKDKYKEYKIDSIASTHGHTVLRLPPYHCNFNAIELIWGQVKDYVAKRNVTFKNKDVQSLFHEAINVIGAEEWAKACRHVEEEEQFYREKDGIIDEVMDRFIINLEDSDEESGEDNGDHDDEDDDIPTDELEGISYLPPDSPEMV